MSISDFLLVEKNLKMAASNVNRYFSKENLKEIVYQNKPPTFWGQNDKLNYEMLSEIFCYLEENNLSFSNIVPVLNLLCGRDVASVIKKPSNFYKKFKKLIEKNSQCLENYVEELYLYTTENKKIGPLTKDKGKKLCAVF